ncbi:hypothetical protein BDQ12DRAFT_694164 [Crucibulum laeve]|uniref:Uncharacterized protein n=1 Tax=Crucibulum laeve TaxID=68775 RepID=A0A5C3LEA1_9AGAR|nr:hypothetical protein BDQ12DRAFT_694164 [Crucibulum laeve]
MMYNSSSRYARIQPQFLPKPANRLSSSPRDAILQPRASTPNWCFSPGSPLSFACKSIVSTK